MTTGIEITGAISRSQSRYIKLRQGAAEACLPLSIVNGREAAFRAALSDHGIIVAGAKAMKELFDHVASASFNIDEEIVEKIGWNGECFALPDGTVFRRGMQVNVPTTFATNVTPCGQSGKIERWVGKVAGRVQDQSIPAFLIMAMFVPPLLRLTGRVDNFAFELVGKPGIGKTTISKIAASVVGGPGQGRGRAYALAASHFLTNGDDLLVHHSDMPMVVEGCEHLDVGGRASTLNKAFSALVTPLLSGVPQDTRKHQSGQIHRVVATFTGNRALAEVFQHDVSDGLITIRVPDDRPFGVFDSLPQGFNDGAAFGRGLLRSAEKHHGHAFRIFVDQLTAICAVDEGAVRDKVNAWVAEFVEQMGVDCNNGRAYRNAEAFGLVYAAGCLAVEYGALPDGWNCRRPVKAVFGMQGRDLFSAPLSFAGRLLALQDDSRIAVGEKGANLPSGKLGIVRNLAGGTRELIVPKANIIALFPDWKILKSLKQVEEALVRDGKHLTTKRSIDGKKPKRVFCFSLAIAE